jgi:hypothetical protein
LKASEHAAIPAHQAAERQSRARVHRRSPSPRGIASLRTCSARVPARASSPIPVTTSSGVGKIALCAAEIHHAPTTTPTTANGASPADSLHPTAIIRLRRAEPKHGSFSRRTLTSAGRARRRPRRSASRTAAARGASRAGGLEAPAAVAVQLEHRVVEPVEARAVAEHDRGDLRGVEQAQRRAHLLGRERGVDAMQHAEARRASTSRAITTRCCSPSASRSSQSRSTSSPPTRSTSASSPSDSSTSRIRSSA